MQSNRKLARFFKVIFFFISVVFAYFLIAMGNLMIKGLPNAVIDDSLSRYYDKGRQAQLKSEIKSLDSQLAGLEATRKLLALQESSQSKSLKLSSDAYDAALSARATTEDSGDNELISDALAKLEHERAKFGEYSDRLEENKLFVTEKHSERATKKADLNRLYDAARAARDAEKDWVTLKVFVFRLAILLPLLVLAFFLLKRYRDSNYWPFVYGWTYFSLYVFFFELVPYLPHYGGYVRSLVGIAITFIVGRYAIQFLQAYLEKTRQLEKEDESVRRDKLQEKESSLEETFRKLQKDICPSCDRSLAKEHKYCLYCGLCIKKECAKCNALQTSFNQFCHECGAKHSGDDAPPVAQPAT